MLNNETLLFALNDAPDELLEKTRRSLRYRAQGRQTGKMRRLGRTLLIAAILTALLVGTAFAARLIGLGGLRAGSFLGVSVLSVEGLSDSPEGQALREWLAYYDEHRNDPFDPEEAFALADTYGAYGVTTREMADKVDELCEKYKLAPLGKAVTPPDERSFYQTAGVGRLTRGSAEYENDYLGGYVYPGGTFQFDGNLFPKAESYVIPYQFRSSAKGSFGYVVTNAGDPNDYTEWTYKTADGHTLTISDSPRGAFFLMERPDSFVTVSIGKSGVADLFNDGVIDGVGDSFVSFELSHEQLEQIAESFDWKALDDPDEGMDGEFTYHEYAERGSDSLLSDEIDLSMFSEKQSHLKLAVSTVYEQQIAPYIRDFELVDYSIEWGGGAMGWISFRGTPKKALDWRRIPTADGELFCRSVCVTMDEQGMPVAAESFDMLPYEKLGNTRNLGTEEKPDIVWVKNEQKELASATLFVKQTGKDYTISDPAGLKVLSLMLRDDEVSSFDSADGRWNPLYLSFTDGSRGLAFTAASGANAVWIHGEWQGYQYGQTLFELFGVPLEARGYTRHDGVLTYRMEESDPHSLIRWVEYDWAENGNPLERRVMSDKLRDARYEYDDADNRVRETWWDGESMTVEKRNRYDADGKLVQSETKSGGMWSKTDYHYDAQGRLIEELHSDSDDLPGAIGGNVYYTYDEYGNCRRTLGWELAQKNGKA